MLVAWRTLTTLTATIVPDSMLCPGINAPRIFARVFWSSRGRNDCPMRNNFHSRLVIWLGDAPGDSRDVRGGTSTVLLFRKAQTSVSNKRGTHMNAEGTNI